MDVHLFSKDFKAKLMQFLAFSSIYFCCGNTVSKDCIEGTDPFNLPNQIIIEE